MVVQDEDCWRTKGVMGVEGAESRRERKDLVCEVLVVRRFYARELAGERENCVG